MVFAITFNFWKYLLNMKVTYTVENQFGETVEYSFRNPMKSRSKAIEQLKLFRGEAKSYKGLRLSYNIDGIQTIDLITGKRMHSDDILKSLANELEILANLDLPYEMPACFTELDEVQYLTIADDLIFLYYFTAT